MSAKTRSKRFLPALTLIILGLAASGLGLTSTAHAEAKLSYFLQSKGKTQWIVWSAANAQTMTVAELPGMPSSAFFDHDGKAAYFVIGHEVYLVEMGNHPTMTKKKSALPTNFGVIRALWRDKSSRRLRVIAMKPKSEGLLSKESDTAASMSRGRSRGIPYLCSVLELVPNDSVWKQIAVRATTDEAGETAGDSVVDDLRQEAGVSSDRLLESYTCKSGQCRNDVPVAFAKIASRKAKRELTNDDLSLWHIRKGLHSILFATVFGDQLHVTAPVLVVSSEASTPIFEVPLAPSEQYGLGVEDGYLLVATEKSGYHPIVVDLVSGSILLDVPTAKMAIWMPPAF